MSNFIEHQKREGNQFVAWSLLNESGEPVKVGTIFVKDGRSFKITDGAAPKHEASTGRVYGEWTDGDNTREYFPNVFDCKWVKVEKSIKLVQPTVEPVDAFTTALTAMVRDLVKVQLVDVVQATIEQLATDGELNATFEEVISQTLDDGGYLSAHEFDVSDYFDEIRDGFSEDMRRDVESVIKEMIHDDSLVIRLV